MKYKTNGYVVDVYHNMLWSKYKGDVFSALNKGYSNANNTYRFIQIAESSGQRSALSAVDLSYHQYPYELLFKGEYESLSKIRLSAVLFWRVFRSSCDVVLLPGYHEIEYWFMLLACILRGKPRGVFVDSTRFDNPKIWWRDILKRGFFSFCDAFFGYGTRSKEYIIELGADGGKIFTHCQAAALPRDYVAKRAFIEREEMLSNDKYIYLYVGRLSPEKGLDILLNAFAAVVQHSPNSYLRLVGGGGMQAQLIKQADELNISHFVDFVGPADLSRLVSYYQSANILVLPSRSEPWGLVVNEALSYCCPAIVSDKCGCVPDLIDEGKTGLSFEVGNVNDLVAKMLSAKSTFSDVSNTSNYCLKKMALYTPANAAAQINAGCEFMLTTAQE